MLARKMKYVLGILLLSLILVVGGAYSAIPEITQLNYSPSPAVPGTTITVLIQLENLDATKQTGVNVELDNNYPFTVKGDTNKNIGNMEKYGKALTQFTIYVDPTAENTTYYLPITITTKDDPNGKKTNRAIIVSGKEPSLKVVNVSENKLVPGQEKELTLAIQNIGTSTAYDIVVELQEDRTVTATGTIVEREITPLGAALSHIDAISPGQTENATIEISVNRGAELKNYTLPIKITYRNAGGTTATNTSYIGIKVSGRVELDATIQQPAQPITTGTTSEITIELFNKGAAEAEFVIAETKTNAGTTELQKQFIGTLQPNDVDSFKTKVTFNKDLKSGPQTIELKIIYQDSDATTKETIIPLQIYVYAAEDAASITGTGMSPVIIIIILIIVVVVGWIIVKKIRKKR